MTEDSSKLMAAHEIEVSWQVLRQIVRDWGGSEIELAEAMPLSGGSMSDVVRLVTSGGARAVVKITPHRVHRGYADEALQLELLREVGMPVPEVYSWKVGTLEDPFSYILMESIEGEHLSEARSRCGSDGTDRLQRHLADLLIKLHSRTAPKYARLTRNDPKVFDSWADCYREIFNSIWHEVLKSPLLPPKSRKIIGKLHERLELFLTNRDCPRLLHWDLWGTNLLAQCGDDGLWRISGMLDPHCKFGDCEAEIAYLELFHTVTQGFLKIYQHYHKLSPDYHRVRKPIYQLYSMLNHALLFGPEYQKPLLEAVERVAVFV